MGLLHPSPPHRLKTFTILMCVFQCGLITFCINVFSFNNYMHQTGVLQNEIGRIYFDLLYCQLSLFRIWYFSHKPLINLRSQFKVWNVSSSLSLETRKSTIK